MLSKTLETGLQRYGIGSKIRALRLNKNLRLAELGAHTGLSPAMLSKIERGSLFPTLPTLLRIALVFGVGLEHFFVEAEKQRRWTVVRGKDRLRLPDAPGKDSPTYLFESLDFPITDRAFEVYHAEFPIGSQPSEPHSHPGDEFIYMMAGRLAVTIDSETVELGQGDALSFASGAPHSYRRQGKSACKVIVITASAAGSS